MGRHHRNTPWTDQERAAALAAGSYEEFAASYPDRSYDGWRIKRGRMRAGATPTAGDGRRLRYLADRGPEPIPARRPPVRHPAGWEPGVAWDGTRGTVTSPPTDDPAPDWDHVLRHFGLDPERFEVLEPVQMRSWEAAIGNGEVRTLWYYRATIRGRRSADERADVDALIARIEAHAPTERLPGGPRALVVALSDWQLGKAGTEATVERILGLGDAVRARLAELRALGRPVATLYACGLGDVVEACDGHYPSQAFEVELSMREQRKVARRLIVALLTAWAPEVERLVVPVVPGNHGEHRKNGAAFTSFGDNSDLEVFEQAAEVLAANPAAYGHVSFVVPRDSLTLALDVHGAILGLAHGHQARQGATVQAKLLNWWKGQSHGLRPVGDAEVLLVGHFHQLLVHHDGPRTLMIAPTLDSGSQWWAETRGTDSRPGTLTFTLGASGWADLQVL